MQVTQQDERIPVEHKRNIAMVPELDPEMFVAPYSIALCARGSGYARVSSSLTTLSS